MEPKFFTAREIAVLLKISKALAYRLIAQGEIPCVRFGRTVRVREEDLGSFIRAHSGSDIPALPRPATAG